MIIDINTIFNVEGEFHCQILHGQYNKRICSKPSEDDHHSSSQPTKPIVIQ